MKEFDVQEKSLVVHAHLFDFNYIIAKANFREKREPIFNSNTLCSFGTRDIFQKIIFPATLSLTKTFD